MILSTTPSVEGKSIRSDHGVVAGEAILGAHLFRTCSGVLFAGIRDIVGGRSGTCEREFARAREIALQELAQSAAEKGANAVVGIDLDYIDLNHEVIGHTGTMPMVTASGTAVKIGCP